MTTFEQRLERRGQNLERNVTKALKDAAEIMLRTVVDNTPKDTGHAAANWQVSHFAPRKSVVSSTAPSLAIASGQSEIASIRLNRAIFISNNVDYIYSLNYGDQRRSPKLFVERAIVAGSKSVARRRKYLGN